MKCIYCSTETDNPKFCSKSCSTSFNNKNSPKRKRSKYCAGNCGKKILSSRMYYPECRSVDNKVTISSVIYKTHHKSSAYALIRSRARAVMKDVPQVCTICKYDKHVEVAHIKSISSFPKETLLEEVNARSNLILLCPNCHWEFDNGITSIDISSV